ncbi:MAG: hypothetical protein ACOYKM_12400 [Caulobacterales bacterium]
MKNAIAAVSVFILTAMVPAFAESLTGAFGNTVNVTLPDGSSVRYYFNADQTYSMALPDGASISGRWEEVDGQVCTTPEGGSPSCVNAPPGRRVGDSWVQIDATGATVAVSISAGR